MAPARPMMQDEIEQKLRGAKTKDVIVPVCCFGGCKRGADFFLTIRFADGSTDMYGLCASDMQKIRSAHPSSLDKPQRQGVFLYS